MLIWWIGHRSTSPLKSYELTVTVALIVNTISSSERSLTKYQKFPKLVPMKDTIKSCLSWMGLSIMVPMESMYALSSM
jgi:hypothetical protein